MEKKRKIIGILLIVLPIVIVFVAITMTFGLIPALYVFGFLACIASVIMGGFYLLT